MKIQKSKDGNLVPVFEKHKGTICPLLSHGSLWASEETHTVYTGTLLFFVTSQVLETHSSTQFSEHLTYCM